MHGLVRAYFLILVLAFVTAGQTSNDTQWHTLTSASGDFSATVPSGYFVYNDTSEKDVSVSGYSGGASFAVDFRKTSKSKELIQRVHDFQTKKGEDADYLIGETRVHVNTYRGTNIYRTSIAVATKRGYYSVSLAALSSDNEVLKAILASLVVERTQLVKEPKTAIPSSAVTLQASSLKSSDAVQFALRRKQRSPVSVQKDVPGPLEDKEIVYSRWLRILRKPVARYNKEGRDNLVNGVVKLRVQLRADGDIGKIWIIKGLPYGLTDQAVLAAKEIKFVPAEVEGKPVDKEVEIEYTFVIY